MSVQKKAIKGYHNDEETVTKDWAGAQLFTLFMALFVGHDEELEIYSNCNGKRLSGF